MKGIVAFSLLAVYCCTWSAHAQGVVDQVGIGAASEAGINAGSQRQLQQNQALQAADAERLVRYEPY